MFISAQGTARIGLENVQLENFVDFHGAARYSGFQKRMFIIVRKGRESHSVTVLNVLDFSPSATLFSAPNRSALALFGIMAYADCENDIIESISADLACWVADLGHCHDSSMIRPNSEGLTFVRSPINESSLVGGQSSCAGLREDPSASEFYTGPETVRYAD